MVVDSPEQLSSGIEELDQVLRGGFGSGRMYLVYGEPGVGKTLLGMHFLEAGLERDETVLFVHGEESREELLVNGAELGIDLDGACFLDLGPESEYFVEQRSYDLVDPSDVERDQYATDIHGTVDEVDPDRIVVDPITQLRHVEPDGYRFRQRILSFMRFLKQRGSTVLGTATPAPEKEYDTEIRSLSDGIVELSRGTDGRRIDVVKHRTFGQRDGDHGMEIRDRGIEIFPALTPGNHERTAGHDRVRSGVDGFDALVGGGFDSGTVTFISGPTGVGKTTLGTTFLAQAAADDMSAVSYLFEEDVETYTNRSESVGIPVTELRERDRLAVEPVEPLARSAEEFAHVVKTRVERDDVDVVMIDGIDGYTTSIQGDGRSLVRKLHALTRYLTDMGVTVLITDEITDVTGISSATSVDASYVADNIVFLSYVEVNSTLRKVVGVLKKRTGDFEHSLRRFEITSDGIHIGDPLTGVRGILEGTPRAESEVRERTHD